MPDHQITKKKGKIIGGILIHEEVKSISSLQTDDSNNQNHSSDSSDTQHIAQQLQLLRDFMGENNVQRRERSSVDRGNGTLPTVGTSFTSHQCATLS